MKCVLADDEEPARLLLKDYISKVPDLDLAGTFSNGLDAFQFIERHGVDVAFLDINMPEMSGLSIARAVNPKPIIIFTTAYSEHASESFDLDVIDYLTKPFSLDRFLKAVNKARHYHQSVKEAAPTADCFFVKADHKIVKVVFNEIQYIEGLREYVRIHTARKKVVTLLSMVRLESILPYEKFIRIHKSTIVNLDFIDAVHGAEVELGNQRLPIGPTYKDAVDKRLHEIGLY